MPASFPPCRPSLAMPPPPQPSPLHFISSRRAEARGSIRLIVAGELDLASSHRFESDLGEAQDHSGRVLLDLAALTFIDCACLGVLFGAANRACREGAVLILLCPHGQVRRMIDLVGSPVGVTILDHDDVPTDRAPVAA